jgi:hypothetical protein
MTHSHYNHLSLLIAGDVAKAIAYRLLLGILGTFDLIHSVHYRQKMGKKCWKIEYLKGCKNGKYSHLLSGPIMGCFALDYG